MKIVAVSACTAGIAHTYMAQEALEQECEKRGIGIKVETQGGMGIDNELEQDEIDEADVVIFAVAVGIEMEARLGVIVHYIADYFTFPHNNHYPGNVKDHCYYERDLKYGMKAFLKTEEALKIKEQVVAYDSVEELTSYIRSIHNSYMKLAHTVEEDIRYIVHACTTVVKSILNMVSYAFSTSVANIQYV